MLLSVSNLSKVYNINQIKNSKKSNSISFKGNIDEFVSKPEIVFGDIPTLEVEEIIDFTKTSKPLDSGWTSSVFEYNGKIIKAPKEKTFANPQLEFQAKGQNLKEYFALQKIKEISPDIATNPYGIIKNKDSYYLIEQMVQGYHPNKKKVSFETLKDLLSKLYSLDTNGIINCDLQAGNIFIDNNKAKLIDFGSYNLITNDGFVAGSDGIPFELFKPNGQIFNETNLDFPIRFMKTFLAPKFSDTKNLMDNPYINMPSNVTNFELRTLYTHLLDNSEENPLEFFKGYLKLKANEYHLKLKSFMQSLNPEDFANNGLNDEQINAIKEGLKKAIGFEELTQNLLQSNDEDIIKAQLAKLQLRTFLNLGDSLKSPIENSKKLQAAYNNLILILEDGIKNNDGDKKEYFSKTLEFFKKAFENYDFVDGQVDIPENEDLIKVLFKKMSETVQDEVKTNVPKIEQKIKSSSNKKLLPFVALGAIIVGVVAFIIKKVNFYVRNKSTPETNKPIDTLINYNLSKKLNSTFLKFKR